MASTSHDHAAFRQHVVDATRASLRRHADGVQFSALAVALLALVALSSTIVWHAMAGEQIRLPQQSHHVAQRTTDTARPDHKASPRRSGGSSPAAAPSAPTAVPAPKKLGGTPVAFGLIAVFAAAGLLVLARARPAPRPAPRPAEPRPATPGPEAAEFEAEPPTEADGQPTEAAAAVPQQRESAATLAPVDEAPQPTQQEEPAPAPATEQQPAAAASPDAGASQRSASSPVVLFDRRLGQRVTFESRARLQWDGHDVSCTTADLSLRGAQLRLPSEPSSTRPPTAGDKVSVTLTLGGTPTIFRARVGWQRDHEGGPAVGLQFLGVQEWQEALLQPIVLQGTPL